MAEFLSPGVEWLRDKLREDESRPVTYKRDSFRLPDISATIGRTLLKLDDGLGGVRIEYTDRDYLIAAEDLVFGGKQIEPERGDRIEEEDGDKLLTYEVMAPAPEPVWRWSDPYRKILRIHTKEIGWRPA